MEMLYCVKSGKDVECKGQVTTVLKNNSITNAVVTPLHKAASYEPRLGIWGDTWL